jgi:hypothetical protein
LQYVRSSAHCEDFLERGWVWEIRGGQAFRSEMGRGMIGKGMGKLRFSSLHSAADHSSAFTSGSVGLRLCRAVKYVS